MARPASGSEYLGDARAFRDNAKTAEDLRLALAVAQCQARGHIPQGL